MLTQRDRNAARKSIENVFKTRQANVRQLMQRAGNWAELAKWTGQSEPFLCAIAGPNPTRTIGEKLARKLEQVLGLASGWMDEAR